MAPNFRQPRHQDAKRLAMARQAPCMKCGAEDGTIVACHYNGPGQERLGKGTGTKCDDDLTVFLCHRCHADFDQYADGNTYERAWEFLFLIALTTRWLRAH